MDGKMLNIPTTAEYLDRVKNALGVNSDYKIWKQTSISQQALSSYRKEINSFDDRACLVFSDLLNENPLALIAASNYQRAIKDPRKDKSIAQWWAHKYAQYTGFELVDDVRNSEDNHETK